MARESRRKREARRLGSSGRLADIIVNTPPSQWYQFPPGHPEIKREIIPHIQQDIMRYPVIDASNVMDYYALHPKCEWDYREDTPCASPPFPSFFVEMKTPDILVINGKEERPGRGHPEAMGWFVMVFDNDKSTIPWVAGENSVGIDSQLTGVRWVLRVLPILLFDGRPAYVSSYKAIAVGADGKILAVPIDLSSGLDPHFQDVEMMRRFFREIGQSTMPLLLTLSFLNCKNVTLNAVEPDCELNRKRAKHGHKPFLRYHTLNIEPMKTVLRTEGRVETEGLQRALHICRGHFATYSEDRPLFGRPGLAGRFWVPAHTRGNIKSGTVVKDYQINPPSGGR